MMSSGAPALADPIDSDSAQSSLGVLEDQRTDPDHGPHEDGEFSEDRLTIEQEELTADLDALEPLAIEGVVPDQEDLPQEWLQETPAGPAPAATEAPPSTDRVPAPPTKSLPGTLDAAPGWQATMSCDPNNKPGMVAFAELISDHYDRPSYSTSRRCIAGNNSQHGEGRAVDWGMNAFNAQDKAIGDAAATWLTKNNGEMARRFGIMSVIWNKKSWYLHSPGSWRTYTGPSPHTDHLHISFTWDGAMKRTSWWSGRAVTQIDYGPCRVYSLQYAPRYTSRRNSSCPTNLPAPPRTDYPVVLPGARSDTVATAQAHLGFTGTDVDGSFGPTTLARLLSHQRSSGVPVTGVLDNATWADFATGVRRVAGADRYGTAANLSVFSKAGGDVYVTTGENYPDALAASARAGAVGAPVLLVKETAIPPDTKKALQRAKARRIFVVGGTTRINGSVLTALRPYASSGTVSRLAGEDRYATAGQVARQFGTSVPVAYVATGENFPDALAGAARAGSNGAPVLLTKKGALPPATISALRAIKPGRIVVLGGTNSVSGSVATALRSYATSRTVERVSGDTRYTTAANLSKFYPSGLDVVYVSTGDNYPDALTGAARAGFRDGPVLLTERTSIPAATRTALNRLNPEAIVVVGGPGAVSGGVLEALESYAD